MTAGSYCYIGPQGIVHGTTVSKFFTVKMFLNFNKFDPIVRTFSYYYYFFQLTLMNAGRKYLNLSDMKGKVCIRYDLLENLTGPHLQKGAVAKNKGLLP